MKKRILTGDRPTGKMHVGHLMGSLLNRVKLQDEYDQFVMIANVQALTDNFENPEKVKESILELLCDYYAVGIDFDKTTVFIQSEVPEIHEIFIFLANFSSIQQLSHNPTLKTEIEQKRFGESTPLGFFIYPIHQAADILCVNANLVPVGKDQAPMVEDCRELARKFNTTYKTEVLSQPQALFGVEKNVPGIDGNEKMGKSLGNAIYISDSEEELRKKVFSTKTDPNRIHATDPGTVEGNTIFTYHDLFNPNKEEVEDLKTRYKAGSVGDVEVKEKLFNAMNEMLKPIRERRIQAEEKKAELLQKALQGSMKVREIAHGVVGEMKNAMKIDFGSALSGHSIPAAAGSSLSSEITPNTTSGLVTFNDFTRNDIRIGQIVSVERVANTDKLLKLIFDFGTEQRQIISGIAQFFTNIQDLVGKQMPVLLNLEPKEFKGEMSYGMIMATDNKDGIVFISPEKEVESGAKVH
jgi:tryptophanyl-tRNA synthetase